MTQLLPTALNNTIQEIGRLPGVGEKTAERYAYFLLKNDQSLSQAIASSLMNLHDKVHICPITFALIDQDQTVSPLYDGPDRNKTIIAVVEEPLDIIPIEKTGHYQGTYHVLGGAISPIDGIGPEQLKIPALLKRIRQDQVKEIIIATNTSVEGESTAIFIQHSIKEAGLNLKITRLARGIPAGVDLEYASQITLTHALEGRQDF